MAACIDRVEGCLEIQRDIRERRAERDGDGGQPIAQIDVPDFERNTDRAPFQERIVITHDGNLGRALAGTEQIDLDPMRI